VQTLASLTFNLQFLKEVYTDPALQVELDQIGLSIKSAIQELREVINELRPPSVIRFGLAKAIQAHTAALRERYPHIHWSTHLTDDSRMLPEPICLTLFRVYQEAANNIVRHAEAKNAWVNFRLSRAHALLEIRDDGKGIYNAQDFVHLTSHSHFGLAGMAERVESIGGEFDIKAQPNLGTTIHVRVPIHWDAGR
jgi:two-component system sensor histidine kinase DegS